MYARMATSTTAATASAPMSHFNFMQISLWVFMFLVNSRLPGSGSYFKFTQVAKIVKSGEEKGFRELIRGFIATMDPLAMRSEKTDCL
jgi:hypothetical protein